MGTVRTRRSVKVFTGNSAGAIRAEIESFCGRVEVLNVSVGASRDQWMVIITYTS